MAVNMRMRSWVSLNVVPICMSRSLRVGCDPILGLRIGASGVFVCESMAASLLMER
jgi:hypothetical protein